VEAFVFVAGLSAKRQPAERCNETFDTTSQGPVANMTTLASVHEERKRNFSPVEPPVGEPPAAPHNIEIEQAVLGALLVWNTSVERLEFLRPEHFFDPLHQSLYQTICGMIAEGRSATPVSLLPVVEAMPEIRPGLSVAQYLGRLATHASMPGDVSSYGRTVFELASRRALIEIAHSMLDSAGDPTGPDPSQLIEHAERSLYDVAAAGTTPDVTIFKSAVSTVVDQSMAAYQGGRSRGLRTGLVDLDDALSGGLQPSDLIILAGRPSIGKTALAINIGWYVADRRRKALAAAVHGSALEDEGGIVHVFSLEMTDTQLAGRVLSSEAEVPWSVIRAGSYRSQAEAEHVVSTSRRIEAAPLYIDYTGGISMPKLASRARRMKRRFGMDLLIIDYLQLMTGGGNSKDGRTQELTQITVGLKSLAKELDVPIIALSQLSRAVEQRSDKRPQLSDLRESGSIEQDADVVMFVFREEYYVERERPNADDLKVYSEWEDKMRRSAGKAEVIFGKQRHGSTGIVNLSWQGQFTRFSSAARGAHANV